MYGDSLIGNETFLGVKEFSGRYINQNSILINPKDRSNPENDYNE